jgi:uncharacterized Zn finger protein (UPF0148 family)
MQDDEAMHAYEGAFADAETQRLSPPWRQACPRAVYKTLQRRGHAASGVQRKKNDVNLEAGLTYCKHCGTKIKKGALFCPNCGAPVKALDSEGWQEPPRSTGTRSEVTDYGHSPDRGEDDKRITTRAAVAADKPQSTGLSGNVTWKSHKNHF